MAFKPGQSGFPQGRARGSKNKRHALFESEEPELQKKLLEMALGGDLGAMKIIADRIWPKRRSEAAPVCVKTDAKDLVTQAEAIIQATLSGELPPDVTRDLTAALADVARLKEFTELEERLAALEKSKHLAPWEQRSELTDWEDDEPKLLPIRGKRRRSR